MTNPRRSVIGWSLGQAVCLLFSLVCSTLGTQALDPTRALTQFSHDQWQMEEGLPKNTVSDLLQTRDGYLWVGTQGGLARFDGVRFSTLSALGAGEPPGPFFSHLLEDREGSLWIATQGGGLVRYRDGRFTTFSEIAGLTSKMLTGICEAKDGGLWVGTYDAGLFRFKEGVFSAVTGPEGCTSKAVRMLLMDRSGVLWVATDGDGLSRIADGKVTALRKRDGLAGNTINCLLEDRRGDLWVGTPEGLNCLRPGGVSHYSKRDGLTSDWILSLFEDEQGGLWVGTYGGGLNRFVEGRFSALTTKEGLSGNIVLALTEDREGSLWIGTSGGLDRLRGGKVTVYTTREGLSDDLTWCVTQVRSGALWVGTQGGVNRLENGRLRRITDGNAQGSEFVWSVLEDRQGDLWQGTSDGLLRRSSRGPVRRYTRADGLSSNQILSLAEARDGSLWVGTDGGGLNHLREGRWTSITAKDGLADDSVMNILEDRAGRLWISTRTGLSSLEGGLLVRHPVQTVCAHEDASGALWFGTVGFGLLRLTEGQFRAITTKAGLFDDVVYSMLEDGQGNLWMGSSRGIGRAKLKDLEEVAAGRRSSLDCLAIGKADGMLSVACSGGCQPSACRSRDGRLWFPTQKGLVCVDPRSIPFNILPPPVLVEEVRVNRKPVPLGSELSLGPRVGDIEFRYTALSLLVPQRVQFKVKLEGYDEDWISMGTQRGVTYARLPPGEYTFRVTACNNDGLWNEAGASVALRVKPHFYETGWFLALCALSALLLAYGFYGIQVRRLKIGKRKLQLLVEERTIQLGKTNRVLEERSRQLESANLQLRELSYRDALTGVANRRHFEEILDAEWRRAVRTGSTLAILMADVDSFKDYNDTFGHPGGDECLRRIASALQAGLRRAGDLLARYGGEEFVVVVSGASLGEARELAEELRARVEALAIPHPGNVVGKVLTLSIGAASCFPRADRSPADLLASADHALYRAKQEGRNRVCTADEADR